MLPRSAAAGLALIACACGSADPELPELPWERAALPAAPEPANNPSTEAKIALGRLLFYDPILSADHATACATCHSEIWGMSDGLPVSVGVDGEGPTGPGREGPNETRRNASSLWNVAHRERLFWDGRAGRLEEQALAPIASPNELGREMVEEAITDIADVEAYRPLFEAAFPGAAIGPTELARALAAFERTLVTRLAPYDRYAAGDAGALSEQAVRGMFLFAEAGCSGCHVPPRFESERYANRAIGDDDAGRYEVTGEPADRGAFRVPTLRNVRDSEPYFHDGSVATLAEAVTHEIDVAIARGESRPLDAAEIEAIVTFAEKALVDRMNEPDRPEEVPSGLPVPEDGFRIPR